MLPAFVPLPSLPRTAGARRSRPPRTRRTSRTRRTPRASAAPDRVPAKVARRSLSNLSLPPFAATLATRADTLALTRRAPTTLQVNIGLTCNLACRHCHVESSPARKESMSSTVAARLVELARREPALRTVDITGGAPEMHHEFRPLVARMRALGLQVMDRCNLTVLETPGQHDLVDFLAHHRVKVVASLPCYTVENVEKQRGDGVFDASIRALQKFCAAGYGQPGSGLELDLVYNPGGPTLPPPQKSLEDDYRRELSRAFGVTFTNLVCITNMPIKRFADDLLIQDRLEEYMQLLVGSFNPDTVDSVMCRDMVHVAWDGRVYDCDFNYALDMILPLSKGMREGAVLPMPNGLTVFDIERLGDLTGKTIRTGHHCYGCTAGSGSSCGGSLA